MNHAVTEAEIALREKALARYLDMERAVESQARIVADAKAVHDLMLHCLDHSARELAQAMGVSVGASCTCYALRGFSSVRVSVGLPSISVRAIPVRPDNDRC